MNETNTNSQLVRTIGLRGSDKEHTINRQNAYLKRPKKQICIVLNAARKVNYIHS